MSIFNHNDTLDRRVLFTHTPRTRNELMKMQSQARLFAGLLYGAVFFVLTSPAYLWPEKFIYLFLVNAFATITGFIVDLRRGTSAASDYIEYPNEELGKDRFFALMNGMPKDDAEGIEMLRRYASHPNFQERNAAPYEVKGLEVYIKVREQKMARKANEKALGIAKDEYSFFKK